jgi:hypothetical protein
LYIAVTDSVNIINPTLRYMYFSFFFIVL